MAHVLAPNRGTVETFGRISPLLELGAGFHPDFSGRDNVFLSGSIYGLSRADVRRHFDEIVAFAELEHAIDRPVRTYSSGMYMRLGFAIASFLDADILLLDEVFAVGDEAFQRKCFGRIFEFKQRGGTIVFVSHDAAAVERLCERALLLQEGELVFDGPTHEAVVRYRRALAAEQDPEERGAGLREWGTGEALIASARLLGPEGEERRQFLSGEPLTLAVEIHAREHVEAPTLQLELRDESGLLIASDVAHTSALGWNGAGRLDATLTVPALPLAFGRFHLRLGLSDASGERVLHWLDDALEFLVYPDGEERGLVRLGGSWQAGANTEAR
jgi:ABC-type polysaccharide/polyol phosphate transport system ATPase subunit